MLGRRSLNLDLTSLDLEIERTLRRRLINSVEMGDNVNAGENERHRGENVNHTRSLRESFAPVVTNSPSCIVLPPTNATYFDLKPHVIQLLPSFHGLDLENPYNHVKKFKDICAIFKFQNIFEESVHLRLFLFSLHDRAKAWFDSNMHVSLTSWENLLNKFYNKFFPMSKVNECRKEIISFTQKEDDKFSKSWERFQEKLIKCPPHGYEKWRLVQFFYQGLTQSNRSLIESMNGGTFLSLTGEEPYRTLNQLSDNSQQWDFSSCRDKSAHIQKKGGIYKMKEDIKLKMKIDALTKKVDALIIGKSINVANTFHVDCCSIHASPIHLAQSCPSLPTFVESPIEQVNAFNDFMKQCNELFFKTYNPGWRNQLNFSWKQNQPMNQGGPLIKPIINTPRISSTCSSSESSSAASIDISSTHSNTNLFFTTHSGGISQGLHVDYKPIN
jgi:hypothetical protein